MISEGFAPISNKQNIKHKRNKTRYNPRQADCIDTVDQQDPYLSSKSNKPRIYYGSEWRKKSSETIGSAVKYCRLHKQTNQNKTKQNKQQTD